MTERRSAAEALRRLPGGVESSGEDAEKKTTGRDKICPNETDICMVGSENQPACIYLEI
jgi:hypothetical protein